MIVCFDCHRPVSASEASIVRLCHRVVYLCPECHAVTGGTASRRLGKALLSRPQGRPAAVPPGLTVPPEAGWSFRSP